MKNTLVLLFFCALIATSTAYNFGWLIDMEIKKEEDLPTVAQVDLGKFAGHWFEIARLPWPEEENCQCAQSTIEQIDGKIVANSTCRRHGIDGAVDSVAVQYVPIDNSNAKFDVYKEDGEFVKKAYVIALDDDYKWALIGDPSRDLLWIKSRDQLLDFEVVKKLIAQARQLGFPVEKLEFDTQVCGSDEKLGCNIPTVAQVDLEKFAGHWYEIARLPFKWTKGCLCSQRNFYLEDNKIYANYTCRRERIDADLQWVQLQYVPLDSTNAKFRVFYQEKEVKQAWVVELDDDYNWVMIVDPEQNGLWISSREPTLDYEVVTKLVQRAEELKFDVEKLIYATQTCGDNYECTE